MAEDPTDPTDYSGARSHRSRTGRAFRSGLRWVPVVVLAGVTVASGAMAAVADTPVSAGAQRSDSPTQTPIISPRRIAPALVVGYGARDLEAKLDAFVARQPSETCLTVDVPGFHYEHRARDPQVPASLTKILTAHAALEALGPDTLIDEAGNGQVDDASSEPDSTPEVKARTVNDLVAHMLTESDNGVAEVLGAAVSDQRGKPAERSAASVVELVTPILGGGEVGALSLADASGLSYDNSLSCLVVDQVLHNSPHAGIIERGLAIGGATGTLEDRFEDTGLVGTVRAKTGTLWRATALAGYVETASGTPARFVLITNVEERAEITNEVMADQQQMLEAIAAYPTSADVADLIPTVG